MFTGNAADTTVIYWIMRDIGAAHRIISADEAGFSGNAEAYYYNNGTNGWALDSVGQTSWPLILNMITNDYGPCLTFLPPNQAPCPAGQYPELQRTFPFRGAFSTATNDYTPTINGQDPAGDSSIS